MDRLDAIEVLLTVVDEGSMSAAGRKLNAPVTSVSRKVAELERRLGTCLLVRTHRNVQLTDSGRDYVDAVRHIVSELKNAELRAAGEYQIPRGELRISVAQEFGRHVVLPLVCEFLKDHPQITLNILAVDRSVNPIDERVDVAIRLGSLQDSSLLAVKAGEVRAVICASPEYLSRKGYPNGLDDLSGHEVAEFNQVQQFVKIDRHWFDQDAHPEVRVSANSIGAVWNIVISGVGIGRLPNFMISEELRKGALVEILRDDAPVILPVYLVYARQGLLPLKVRTFLDWMVPRLRRTLNELG